MNLANLNKLIYHLENNVNDEHFNMGQWCRWRADCGTVACLAGYCILLQKPNAFKKLCEEQIESPWISGSFYLEETPLIEQSVPTDAARWLGIKLSLAYKLFSGDHRDLHELTREQALCVLRILRETGKVNWDNPEQHWAEIEAKLSHPTEALNPKEKELTHV